MLAQNLDFGHRNEQRLTIRSRKGAHFIASIHFDRYISQLLPLWALHRGHENRSSLTLARIYKALFIHGRWILCGIWAISLILAAPFHWTWSHTERRQIGSARHVLGCVVFSVIETCVIRLVVNSRVRLHKTYYYPWICASLISPRLMMYPLFKRRIIFSSQTFRNCFDFRFSCRAFIL